MDIKKRTTIIDIAKACGVSKTTVSFAFNSPNRISQETYKLIMETAKKLDYIPNPAARNFSLQKRHTIGFLLPQQFTGTLSNPYLTKVLEGIGNICINNDYTLTLIPPFNGSILEAIKKSSVDGFVAMGTTIDKETTTLLDKLVIPYVLLDGAPEEDMPSINIDDQKGAYEIMKEVLSKGHKDIAIIAVKEDMFNKAKPKEDLFSKRLKGFEKALKEYNLSLSDDSINIYKYDCSLSQGRMAGEDIINKHKSTTAVVAMSDIQAIGCMSYLQENGYHIPDDISVVGFDDIQTSTIITPNLTTVGQPAAEKGETAATLLFNLINHKPVANKHIILPYSIVIRNSLSFVNKK